MGYAPDPGRVGRSEMSDSPLPAEYASGLPDLADFLTPESLMLR